MPLGQPCGGDTGKVSGARNLSSITRILALVVFVASGVASVPYTADQNGEGVSGTSDVPDLTAAALSFVGALHPQSNTWRLNNTDLSAWEGFDLTSADDTATSACTVGSDAGSSTPCFGVGPFGMSTGARLYSFTVPRSVMSGKLDARHLGRNFPLNALTCARKSNVTVILDDCPVAVPHNKSTPSLPGLPRALESIHVSHCRVPTVTFASSTESTASSRLRFLTVTDSGVTSATLSGLPPGINAVDLSGNCITQTFSLSGGLIPASEAAAASLVRLDLSRNQVTGPVVLADLPITFGSGPAGAVFAILDLSQNNVSGSPMLRALPPYVGQVNLSFNGLTGFVELVATEHLRFLTSVDLRNNSLDGAILGTGVSRRTVLLIDEAATSNTQTYADDRVFPAPAGTYCYSMNAILYGVVQLVGSAVNFNLVYFALGSSSQLRLREPVGYLQNGYVVSSVAWREAMVTPKDSRMIPDTFRFVLFHPAVRGGSINSMVVDSTMILFRDDLSFIGIPVSPQQCAPVSVIAEGVAIANASLSLNGVPRLNGNLSYVVTLQWSSTAQLGTMLQVNSMFAGHNCSLSTPAPRPTVGVDVASMFLTPEVVGCIGLGPFVRMTQPGESSSVDLLYANGTGLTFKTTAPLFVDGQYAASLVAAPGGSYCVTNASHQVTLVHSEHGLTATLAPVLAHEERTTVADARLCTYHNVLVGRRMASSLDIDLTAPFVFLPHDVGLALGPCMLANTWSAGELADSHNETMFGYMAAAQQLSLDLGAHRRVLFAADACVAAVPPGVYCGVGDDDETQVRLTVATGGVAAAQTIRSAKAVRLVTECAIAPPLWYRTGVTDRGTVEDPERVFDGLRSCLPASSPSAGSFASSVWETASYSDGRLTLMNAAGAALRLNSGCAAPTPWTSCAGSAFSRPGTTSSPRADSVVWQPGLGAAGLFGHDTAPSSTCFPLEQLFGRASQDAVAQRRQACPPACAPRCFRKPGNASSFVSSATAHAQCCIESGSFPPTSYTLAANGTRQTSSNSTLAHDTNEAGFADATVHITGVMFHCDQQESLSSSPAGVFGCERTDGRRSSAWRVVAPLVLPAGLAARCTSCVPYITDNHASMPFGFFVLASFKTAIFTVLCGAVLTRFLDPVFAKVRAAVLRTVAPAQGLSSMTERRGLEKLVQSVVTLRVVPTDDLLTAYLTCLAAGMRRTGRSGDSGGESLSHLPTMPDDSSEAQKVLQTLAPVDRVLFSEVWVKRVCAGGRCVPSEASLAATSDDGKELPKRWMALRAAVIDSWSFDVIPDAPPGEREQSDADAESLATYAANPVAPTERAPSTVPPLSDHDRAEGGGDAAALVLTDSKLVDAPLDAASSSPIKAGQTPSDTSSSLDEGRTRSSSVVEFLLPPCKPTFDTFDDVYTRYFGDSNEAIDVHPVMLESLKLRMTTLSTASWVLGLEMLACFADVAYTVVKFEQQRRAAEELGLGHWTQYLLFVFPLVNSMFIVNFIINALMRLGFETGVAVFGPLASSDRLGGVFVFFAALLATPLIVAAAPGIVLVPEVMLPLILGSGVVWGAAVWGFHRQGIWARRSVANVVSRVTARAFVTLAVLFTLQLGVNYGLLYDVFLGTAKDVTEARYPAPQTMPLLAAARIASWPVSRRDIPRIDNSARRWVCARAEFWQVVRSFFPV